MARKWNRGVVAAAGLGLALGITACDNGTDPEDQPRVSVFLTDAPGDVDAVWLDLGAIELIDAGDDVFDLPLELDDLILLTDLTDGTLLELVDEAALPEETVISQIRLMVDGVVLLTNDGDVFATADAVLPEELEGEEPGNLHCPSCFQTGLKVVIVGPAQQELEEDEETSIVLDFDVARSLAHPAGQSGMWIMRPVIHARFLEGVNGTDITISGTVQLASEVEVPACGGQSRSIEDFIPIATAETLEDEEEDPIVLAGDVQSNGSFAIHFVAPDDWNLSHLDTDLGDFELVWTADVSPDEVEVTEADGASGVVYTITDVTCEATS